MNPYRRPADRLTFTRAAAATLSACSLAAVLTMPVAGLQTASPQPGTRAAAASRALQPVNYEVRFPNAVHHEARITVTFRGLPTGRPLQAVMSRTSPGRYAVHDFAKNVYDVAATDGAGRALRVTRATPYQWNAAGHNGTVKLSYTVFADHADGTYAGIDSTHAHFNMPAAFIWARGFERNPVSITFHPRAGWKVATQLINTSDPNTFTAPHRDYFLDSPVELSDYELREWKVGPGGKYTIRLAVHTIAPDSIIDRYATMAARVVEEEAAVFGEYPAYDHGVYTFLADYLPWAVGDGMEHRNSTILTSGRVLGPDNINQVLGTLVHEHFHAWNMERLRDRDLEPFDFENADMSDNLWFGEGFTSYYTPLIPTRAGYTSLQNYAGSIGGTINAVVNGPGRAHNSPIQMSQYAAFADAAVSNDPTNRANTFISYYTYGSAIGLGLDLVLRTRFDLTLDGYMRALWTKYGKPQANYAPLRPYTTADLRRTLGEYTKSTAFADDFFRRYIEGREVVDYAPLLARAGLLLRTLPDAGATAGAVQLRFDSTGATVLAPTEEGSAWYLAGIGNRDRIVALNGRAVNSAQALSASVAAHKPGESISVDYVQRGQTKRSTLVLQPVNRLEVVTYEAAGLPLTPAITQFRTAWLGTQVK